MFTVTLWSGLITLNALLGIVLVGLCAVRQTYRNKARIVTLIPQQFGLHFAQVKPP